MNSFMHVEKFKTDIILTVMENNGSAVHEAITFVYHMSEATRSND